MNDLKLWRMLTDQEVLDEQAALNLYESFAMIPNGHRWIFIGGIVEKLRQQGEILNAAILPHLNRISSPRALQKIAKELASENEQVVAGVCECLNSIPSSIGRGLVHGLFSRNAKARVAAVQKISSPFAAMQAMYLLVDNDIRELTLEKILEQRLPVDAIQPIRRLAQAEAISKVEARRLLFGILQSHLLSLLERCVAEPLSAGVADIKKCLLAAENQSDAVQIVWNQSSLEWLVDLFWSDESDEQLAGMDAQPRDVWIRELEERIPKSPIDSRRLFLAIARCMRDRDSIPLEYATLLASCDIDFFKLKWVFVDVRREVARLLLSESRFVRQQPDEAVNSVLQTELVQTETGELDLEVIGGLLLASKDPFTHLCNVFSTEQLSQAFWDRPEIGVRLFALPGKTNNKSKLFESICHGKKSHSTRVVAMMVAQIPEVAISVLDHLKLGDPVKMFLEIEQVIDEFGFRLSSKKYRLIGKSLAHKMLGQAPKFLKAYMSKMEAPEKSKLGLEIFSNLSREIQASYFLEYVLKLTTGQIRKLLKTIDYCDGVPYGFESLLATVLAKNSDSTLQKWAQQRIALGQSRPKKQTSRDEMRPLTDNEVHAIATCADSGLEKKTHFLLKAPVIRLVEALRMRGATGTYCRNVCAGLVVCGDDLADVDHYFGLYSESLNAHALDLLMVDSWKHNGNLSLLGHVLLWRWEFHLFNFELMVQQESSFVELLTLTRKLKSNHISNAIWKATASLTAILAARAKERLEALVNAEFIKLQLEFLTTSYGEQAAKILIGIYRSNRYPKQLAAIEPQLRQLMPSIDPKVRQILSHWIDVTGLGNQQAVRRSTVSTLAQPDKQRISEITDLQELEKLCLGDDSNIVSEACLRLVALGEPGERVLVQLLENQEPPPFLDVIAASISLWSDFDCLDQVEKVTLDLTRSLPHRYFVAINLMEAGRVAVFETLSEILQQESQESFFVRSDWKVLTDAGIDEFDLATRLATSPQPNAYYLAIRHLIENIPNETALQRSDRTAALRAFLECGTQRSSELRYESAVRLFEEGDSTGLVVLLGKWSELSFQIFPRLDDASLEVIVRSATTLGQRELEDWVCDQILSLERRNEIRTRLLEILLDHSTHATTVGRVTNLLTTEDSSRRQQKLTEVARSFKWGQEQSRRLLNSEFKMSMLSGSDLGYTRLKEEKVFINVLPILKRKQHGRQIVEGLIVHELGHHIFHKGKNAEVIWKRAEKEGLHSLLNIVADEHLERNLRAADPDFDLRLKRLGAYAFQHMPRDIKIDDLLSALGIRAFEILTESEMAFCDRPDSVRIEGGQMLMELEKTGNSFARFFRSLRMGLGNRHNDPLVAKGLELFKKNFRKSSMEDLYKICLELRSIFPDEIGVGDTFGMDQANVDQLGKAADGITDAEIEREIQRITSREELESGNSSGDQDQNGGNRFINVIDELEFDQIKQIIKLPFHPLAWSTLSKKVASHGKLLKKFLVGLGQRFEIQRRRLTGHRVDRAAISRLVIRNDPRVMMARQTKIKNDLFIGVAVDCSGSMEFNDNIETAKKFAAVLAYAVRDIEDIDLRTFGFTDTELFDAGDERRPAIHPLATGAGNNDAAALWHIAQLALASKRKSKLLVMISDGLPTECSVAALRGLVTRLTKKMGICCAQIAVEDLEEVCFPHYVLVKEADEFAAVRKFGRTVASLVKTALKV